jgi:hypothetical protein
LTIAPQSTTGIAKRVVLAWSGKRTSFSPTGTVSPGDWFLLLSLQLNERKDELKAEAIKEHFKKKRLDMEVVMSSRLFLFFAGVFYSTAILKNNSSVFIFIYNL